MLQTTTFVDRPHMFLQVKVHVTISGSIQIDNLLCLQGHRGIDRHIQRYILYNITLLFCANHL